VGLVGIHQGEVALLVSHLDQGLDALKLDLPEPFLLLLVAVPVQWFGRLAGGVGRPDQRRHIAHRTATAVEVPPKLVIDHRAAVGRVPRLHSCRPGFAHGVPCPFTPLYKKGNPLTLF
jgi:hypothetical protein